CAAGARHPAPQSSARCGTRPANRGTSPRRTAGPRAEAGCPTTATAERCRHEGRRKPPRPGPIRQRDGRRSALSLQAIRATRYKNWAVKQLRAGGDFRRFPAFREAKNLSVRVLLDWHAVVHLIHAKNLRFAAVATQFVIFAHDERLDRFGRADLGAQPAEAAAREVEVEVVEHLDLLARLAMTAERD